MSDPLNNPTEAPKLISVLWLSLAENMVDHRYGELIALADQHACTIDFVRLFPPFTDEHFAALVQSSDSFIVSMNDVVCYAPFRAAVVAAVRAGKRLLVLTPRMNLNELLKEFDLAVTKHRLCDTTTFTNDSRTLYIRSPRNSGHPITHALFADAALTTIGSPSRMWYRGEALPLLVAGEGTRLLTPENFFEPTGARVLCAAGFWPLEPKKKEGVLVFAGNCFNNPLVASGKFLPGIRANVALAEAVIEWLRGDLEPTPNLGLVVERLHAIEVGLYDIVVTILKRHFTETPDAWWYEGISDGMRKKAAELSEESKGEIPKEEGFFFIAYKKIIEENWTLFNPYFETDKKGKKSIDWMQALNDLRNRLSHPMRIRKKPVTAAETRLVSSRYKLVSNLQHSLQIYNG